MPKFESIKSLLSKLNSFPKALQTNSNTQPFSRQLISLLLIYAIVFQSLFFAVPSVQGQSNGTGNFASRLIGQVSDLLAVDETVEPSAEENQVTFVNSVTAFGPKKFTRTKGAPNVYIETFTLPTDCANGTYKLVIKNGEQNGTFRISSAEVKLNGTTIFEQSDFNQNVYLLDRPVQLMAENTLWIRLTSPPNSYLHIEVIGENCDATADTIPPMIVVTSPEDNFATTAPTVTLRGTAEDQEPNPSGIAGVWVDGTAATYNQTTKIWELTNVSLDFGSNLFTARTVDNAGNEATTQITIIRDVTNPTVNITTPGDGAITLNSSLAVSGTAADTGGDSSGINRVTVNGTEAVFDPLTGQWSLAEMVLAVGTNTITAIAYDRAGNQANAQITVTRAVNQAPQVNAGQNQTIALPDTAVLNGTATDDGYPLGNGLSVFWSKASGPGNVSFNNPTALQTAAVFSASGEYILQLAVSDGQYTSTDNISITVHPENQAPQVNAGVDQTIELPNQTVLNGTAIDDGYPTNGTLSVFWSKVSGDGIVNFTSPTSVISNAEFSNPGTYVLKLTATDGTLSSADEIIITVNPENQAPQVNAGADQTIELPNQAVLNGSATDDGYPQGNSLTYSWGKVSGDGTVAFTNQTAGMTSASFSQSGTYILRLTVSDGGLSTGDEVTITVLPENQAPQVNAGVDQTVTLPNTIVLSGNANDDGYPQNGSLSFVWLMVSGTGLVTFETPNSLSTNASFSQSGIYILRLTAADGQFSASDDVTVTVNPENQAPQVEAGADQTVQLPDQANLNGVVTDDGWPQGQNIATEWSKVSGPGEVVFASPQTVVTTASFSLPGSYVLKLTANDSELTAEDTITIEVRRQGTAPTAEFGFAQTGGPLQMTVLAVSSVNQSGNGPIFLLDEVNSTYWLTAAGQNTNQFVKFELAGGEQPIAAVKLEKSNVSFSAMIKDFVIQVSTTTTDDAAFTTVANGTLQNLNGLQTFVFPNGPVFAKYVKIIGLNTQSASSTMSLGTLQVIGAGTADNIVSLPGRVNVARNGSPSMLKNGGAITRWSSFNSPPTGLINNGTWTTLSTVNEFAVIKLAGTESHQLKGIRMGGNFQDTTDYWVKDFEIWVSNTVDEDSAFTKVLDGVKTTAEARDYLFPAGPVDVKFIKYVPKTSRGNTAFIGTQTVEAIPTDGVGVVSFSGDYQFNKVENAFDETSSTSWYCRPGQTTNQFVKLRLDGDRPQKIFGLKMFADNNQNFGLFGPKDYRVSVSTTTDDEAAFTTVHTGTFTSVNAVQEIRFAQPVDAKYVRFDFLNGYSTSWLIIRTLEVLAFPIDGAMVTNVSSQADPTVLPAKIIDLDQSQMVWQSVSGQNTNQSISVRLYDGEVFDINHISIRPGWTPFTQTNMSPKDFDIQVSETDEATTSFNTVFSGTIEATDKLQHFYFPSVRARYVRLLLRNNYGNAQMGLKSFFVYAENTGGTETRFFNRSTDPDNDVVSYLWDFGDGTTSTDLHPFHQYAVPGLYFVNLTATDSQGASVTITRPYRALPQLKADFTFSPTTASESDQAAWRVNFADLSSSRLVAQSENIRIFTNAVTETIPYESSGSSLYRDNGDFSATLQIASDYVLNYRTTKNIPVLNQPPVININDGRTVYWGENWTNAPLTLTDPSPIDRTSLQGVWDFGDGQTSICSNCTTGNAQGLHSYSLPGNYNARLTITDKDGGTSSDTAVYNVIKRPTAVQFQTPVRNGDQVTLRGTLRDTFGNLPLAGKPVSIVLNGFTVSVGTQADGTFETVVALSDEAALVTLIANFTEDAFYQASSSIYAEPPTRTNPPAETPTNGGKDFWLSFPANFTDGLDNQYLLITAEANTTGTAVAAGCGLNQSFSVTANIVTRVNVPRSCQLHNSDQIQNLGVRVTTQAPVVVYGMNERPFTTDAYLGLPINTLGKDYLILTYGNTVSFEPSSQFAVVATENNTNVTITPKVTTGARVQNVPFQITLNAGQTYLLKNTENGAEKDLTGSSISADKPVAAFSGHKAATLPPPVLCCADHLVEQLPPINTFGKRFLAMPTTARTGGDIFRFAAASDNTFIYLNGLLATVLNKGEFFEKIIKTETDIIATEPILVGQFAASSRFDGSVTDPFMAIVPPYSQFLNHYTIATQTRFTNYINLAVPTAIVGQVTLNGNPIAINSFTPIGNSGFSGAKIQLTQGTHNLDGPAPFGVFSYGYTTDEGYGYPGGMSLIPTVRSSNLSVTPETSAFGINSEACLTATLRNQDNQPLGGKQIALTVSGANSQNSNGQTDASGNFEFCYTGANVGSDNAVFTVEGQTVTATVIWSPPNSAPLVEAGPDQVITLPTAAQLNGSATDDGYPAGSLTYNWSKVSGSGNVTFTNQANLSTSAQFETNGEYILRLTVGDGQFTVTDELTVTVNPEPPNTAPQVSAGADQTAQIGANLVRNPSAELEPAGGEIPDWFETGGSQWTATPGGQNTIPSARFGQKVFVSEDIVQGELRQDVDVRAFAAGIDAGTQIFALQAFVRSGQEQNADTGRIVFEYRDRTNQQTLGVLDSGEIATFEAWHLTEDERVPPVGTGFIRIRLIAARNSGVTTDVFFDGVSIKASGATATVKLAGTAIDDGLPTGSGFEKNWTKISGGGNAIFDDPTAVDSAVTFDAPGSYLLRLTATDGQFTTSDELTVTVTAANAPPTVGAGADQTLTLPATAQLNGAVADDGTDVRHRWTKISGPGTVSFSNAQILNPTAAFSQAGSYVLRLTAEDGELETFDDVTMTVNPSPVNQPPTIESGANQSVTLPVNSVTLSGTAADDGLPSNALTTVWTKRSGAGTVSFSNANDPQTTVTFDAAGSYILRLTGTDGQYTVWDELVVTVYPEGGGGMNQAPTVDVGADQTVTLAQNALLEAQVADDGLPTGGSFSALWTRVSGDGEVTFSNPNQTATFASFSQTGTYILRLTVSDSELSAFDEVTVTVVPNQTGPTVEILTPDDGAGVTEPTTVSGAVSGGNWTLDYSLNDTDNLDNRVWTPLANGSGAVSGNLGVLDTTLLLNGLYDIRLRSVDQFGQTSTDLVSVAVEENLKVGHFTVSFDDMSVPLAGVPIQIIRTYDSRDKRRGDFGAGWTLSLRNVRLQKSAVLGLRWYQTRSNAFIPTYCVQATRPHIVTVTMPDGQVEKFEAKLQQECQQAAPLGGGNLIFVPQGNTRGRLETLGLNEVAVAGSVPGPVELLAFDGTGIFDRATFKYISKDGTEFIVNQSNGLQSVKDTNGNTLTITPNGITHSSGVGVSFTRDALGRITQITDPEGVSNVYSYNANGDLVSYKDRENNTTTFTYEPQLAHHLKTIVDPLGRTPIRNDYDTDGRLLKHTDAEGREIVYTHNLAARVEIVTDRLGNQTTYEYDTRGNVLKKRDALGNETTYSYDADDNVLSETDALGRTTTNTYDASGNRTSVTDALGNRTEMTYNSQGRVLTVKDARNNVTTNTYDTAGNLLTTTDPQGRVTTNLYSIQTGQLTRTTDALGHITRFEYTGSYLTKQTDAQGNETTFGYDANGNRSSQTVRRTNAQGQLETITTAFEFDSLNRLTKTTNPDGSFTRTEYNALGQQSATVDQGGQRTEFEYDTLGRLIKTTYADGRFEESTFDAEGRRLTSKDRSGKITSYEYDALGRLKKTIYSDGTFTRTAYDAAGQVLNSTDARGQVTQYTYDDAGRRLTVKNALDQTTGFGYDAAGNQTSMTDALGRTTGFVYDSLNRRTRTDFADGTFTETTFDELGRRTAEKDQAGKVTEFFYDSLSRLTKVKDALNQETRYEYNELGQQTKQIDALGRETRYEYDRLGRRTKRILPLGQTETYSYSTNGDLQARTDFNGKTTTFGYDAMRRLLTKTPDASLNEPTVSFTYNDLGQRATMTDASGTTVYSYDTRNRLQTKQTPNGTLSYTYDETGNIETLRSSNANGVSVDYDYDELNRLKSVRDNRLTGNQTTTYSYDAVGNLQSYSYPNQVTTSYAYNNLNRLTTMTVSNSTSGLASYQYTLGASGNRTQVVENTGRTVNYAYDDLYRLTSETIANGSNNGAIAYQFDAVGNRLNRNSNITGVQNQVSTYDANDRLNSDVYDANGNTKVSNGRQFNYDFENKLNSTSDGITIVYDGDGNRVSKTVNGVTTKYLVDTNNLTGYAQVVEEIQGGNVTKSYTYGLDLISQRQNSTVNFYQYDGHGSVRSLTDVNANLTDTYTYDAFGTIIERTGTTSNNYLYAGEQFDADLGFYYNRARYLNVETGRFVSMDSYEGKSTRPMSLHKYLYADADGINNTDPSGNFSLKESLIVVNVIGTLAAYLFQGTTRAIAPGNDPFENYYYETQADYRDAQINLALLVFALFQVTAGAKIAASSSGPKTVGSTPVFGGGRNIYNPSNKGQNCAACVSAVIKSKKTGRLVTADEIENAFGELQPQNSVNQAVAATEEYIENSAGVTLKSWSSLNDGPGQYVILRKPTNAEPTGHVVWARVYKSGNRIIVDPQTGKVFDVGKNGITTELRQIIGGQNDSEIYKVLE